MSTLTDLRRRKTYFKEQIRGLKIKKSRKNDNNENTEREVRDIKALERRLKVTEQNILEEVLIMGDRRSYIR